MMKVNDGSPRNDDHECLGEKRMITARFENGMAQADRLEGAEEAYQVTYFLTRLSTIIRVSWTQSLGEIIKGSLS